MPNTHADRFGAVVNHRHPQGHLFVNARMLRRITVMDFNIRQGRRIRRREQKRPPRAIEPTPAHNLSLIIDTVRYLQHPIRISRQQVVEILHAVFGGIEKSVQLAAISLGKTHHLAGIVNGVSRALPGVVCRQCAQGGPPLLLRPNKRTAGSVLRINHFVMPCATVLNTAAIPADDDTVIVNRRRNGLLPVKLAQVT